ncbi:MAG: RNA polymerase sigma factor [Blastocatellia bacterium]|nr:RNA polymerase sigma factor [Blastocatellia bacterium]
MTINNDQDRFLTLLEQNKKILYKVVNIYCKQQDDRADLLQEIVIQLWRSFTRFDNRCLFSTWMYKIAINVAISFYRSQSRNSTVDIKDFVLELTVADQMLEQTGDDLRLMYKLISQLDEFSRILILLYLDGYSQDEIAHMVGISPTNVSTKVSRIKQKLQRDFDSITLSQKEPNL